MSKMRDADMPLTGRIDAAIERITHGQAAMRVPVEATDPDVVLADCQREIERLTNALWKACGDDAEIVAGCLEAVTGGSDDGNFLIAGCVRDKRRRVE